MKFSSCKGPAAPLMVHSVFTVILRLSSVWVSKTLTRLGRLLGWSLLSSRGMVALQPVPHIRPMAALLRGLLENW